jgi:ubiquinone/menaquinone biosynthesis C-methylase UbiE
MTEPSHLDRVRSAFTQQADSFDAYADKADIKVEDRFRGALGAAGAGDLLDIACGPGAVTVAIAKGARSVVGLDATDAMLEKARARAKSGGLTNTTFQAGDAENLPFETGRFDGIVTRLALHHFANPGTAVNEMFRVLRPGGRVVIVDVTASEEADKAQLQNAIEILRDPSHIRMMPAAEIDGLVGAAGFQTPQTASWDKAREFEEWMGIVNDPAHLDPLRIVVRALAEDRRDAGIGLRVEDGKTVFFHRWRLIAADKP